VSIVILPLGLMGAIGAFHAAERTIAHGTLASRALAAVQSRIEAKRSAQWERLLIDDLNNDGLPETVMHDDGQHGDLVAGDGVYSANRNYEGVSLTWTVTLSRSGNLSASGYAVLEARASYDNGRGQREVKLAAVRANPVYVGQ
jgi:hypothetical protein